MWELGIATGADTRETSVVVFQCTDDRPHVRINRKLIDVRKEEDAKTFATSFHRDRTFTVPSCNEGDQVPAIITVLGETDRDRIGLRSAEFLEEMRAVIPSGRRIETHRLDYLQCTLYHTHAQQIERKRQAARDAQRDEDIAAHDRIRAEAIKILKDNVVVRSAPRSQRTALAHFGIGEGVEESLDGLYQNWLQQFREEYPSANPETGWFATLMEDFSRATEMRRSRNREYQFKSVETGMMLRPVIVRCIKDGDGTIKYDVYLFAMESAQGEDANPAPASDDTAAP